MELFKKIFMPTGAKKEVQGLRSWTVRWCSYRQDFSYYAKLRIETEVFLSEQDAKDFVDQLKESFKFTKSDIPEIKITENVQK